MNFNIHLHPSAISDLQKAIEYYDEQSSGLGKKFENAVDKHLSALSKNPFYQIRYDNVRCLPIKKYPFMIHFIIDEVKLIVHINAVLHTSLNPLENWIKH